MIHTAPRQFSPSDAEGALKLSRGKPGYNEIKLEFRYRCMRNRVRDKFMDPVLRSKLVGTHPRLFVERVKRSAGHPVPRWGVDASGTGNNLLGAILMVERSVGGSKGTRWLLIT